MPFLFLALVELSLRVFDVDKEHQSPFIELTERDGYQAFNPLYPARYFQTFSPSVSFDPFTAQKEFETFRVVVLGGSSTAGFPFSHQNGFPSLLRDRLRRYTFDQRVEVISLAMTAVNSFTIWDMSDEVVALEPDAVIIYAGHNEFYGAFGVGSSEYGIGLAIWPKRLLLTLKNLVLFRLMERAILGGGPSETNDPDGRTMMARVVSESGIPFNGVTYRAGVKQFEANLSDVVARFHQNGIPVFLGTLASNLADQPPLGSNPSAQSAYANGKDHLAAGDSVVALNLLNRARDLDEIRFRAPDTLNAIIRAVAKQHDAVVVETEARLLRESEGGITGASLFEDHLHPNHHGYALIADEFFEAVRDLDSITGEPLAEWDHIVEMLDPIDSARADLQISRLKGGYPFRKGIDRDIELADYQSTLDQHLNGGNPYDSLAVRTLAGGLAPQEGLRQGIRSARASGDTLSAIKLSKSLLAWQPFNQKLMDDFLSYATGSEPFDRPNMELALASYSLSGSPFHLNTLAALSLRQGHVEDASRLLDMVEAVNPNDRVMLYNKARVLVLSGDTLAAREYARRFQSTP